MRDACRELAQLRQTRREALLALAPRQVGDVSEQNEETGMQRANFQALMKKYNIRVRDTEYDSGEAESS